MSEAVLLKKAPARRFLVFVIMLLSWAQIYMGMQTVAIYGTEIMASLGINNTALSMISNGVTLALGIMCVASGMIATKLGGKKTILLGCAIQAVAGLLFFTNPSNVGFLVVIRIIEGMGGGLINAFALSLIAAWFPRNERAFASGLQMGLYGIAISATTLFCNAFNSMGLTWMQGCGTFVAGAAIICGLLVAFLYTDIEKKYGVYVIDDALEPETYGDAAATVESSKPTFKRPATYKELFKSPVFWMLAIPVCANTAVSYNLAYCIPLLLPEVGYTSAEIVAATAVVFMGTIIFSPLGGVISDRGFHGRRGQTIAISFILGLIGLIIMLLLAGKVSIMVLSVVTFLAYGICFLGNGPTWALPAEIFEPSFLVRGNGILLLTCNLVGMLNIALSGIFADAFGSYVPGLMVTIILMAVAVFCALILTRKYRV